MHVRLAKYAPNMIPELVKLRQQLSSLYQPLTKWDILLADRYIEHTSIRPTPPLNADHSGRLVGLEDSDRYVINGDWEVLSP